MYSLKKAVLIYSNKELFEEIHEAKKAFIGMLENISKRVDLDDLKKIHAAHKGIKISKGNELEHCPYQVLDLIRDFDSETGLNIRLLHWWGKGMFLFILVGKDYFRREIVGLILANQELADFMISTSLSPFAYKLLVEDFEKNNIPQSGLLSDYSALGRFQLMKQLPYGEDFSGTEELILSELNRIIFTLQKIERK
jgi:hypothetical protein